MSGDYLEIRCGAESGAFLVGYDAGKRDVIAGDPEARTTMVIYAFAEFELDPQRYELRRDGHPCQIEPQVFDVLACLVTHRDRVVTKQELLDAVWGDRFVSEATMSSRVMAARKAIDDDGQTQRFIRTIRGRGFRFVGEVVERTQPDAAERDTTPEATGAATDVPLVAAGTDGRPAEPGSDSIALIGREAEIAEMERWLRGAKSGARQVVFVTGEAGIGKTTLVDAFLARVQAGEPCWIGRGQCLQHQGSGEAYMPVLESLGRLCQGPSGEEITAILARRAPSWVMQMPWVISPDELVAVQARAAGATRERMLREMVEAVEAMAALRPLVLVFEDLHWSDPSTLDLLARLAVRREPARLLVVGTFREADARSASNPLWPVVQDLRVRQQCVEISLGFLSEDAVRDYLSTRFPSSPAGELAPLLAQRTEGNPLFMSRLVDWWVERGAVRRSDGRWTLTAGIDDLSSGVPATLRDFIEQQLDRVSPDDRAMLEAASVAGMTFSAASVAAGAGQPDEPVEERCAALARQGQVLEALGTAEWRDGTVAGRFGFIHHLYREALYDNIPAVRRARLHASIGLRQETGYGARAHERAAELAIHFVQGRDAQRAVTYLLAAAAQAIARNAHQEAVGHLRTGLDLVQAAPESPESREMELDLQLALAPALVPILGWAAPEVAAAFGRAREISRLLGHTPQTFAALYGLATMHEYRGEYRQSQTLMEERLRLASGAADASLAVESYELLACSLFHQGAFKQALEQATRALDHYDPARHEGVRSLHGKNTSVAAHAWAAQVLWFLGYPDRATARIGEAVARAREVGHLYSVASALSQAAFVSQYRRDPAAAREWAEAALVLSSEQGFRYRIGTSSVVRGWAVAAIGREVEGITQIRHGLTIYRETGSRMETPYFLAMLAEAYAMNGQPDQGLHALDEALALVENSRSFFYEAELHRLRGALTLQANPASGAAGAERQFAKALEIARGQQARALELRAAMSLGALWASHGRRDAARDLLAPVMDSFTEGLDTPDLIAAQTLLGWLSGGTGEIPFTPDAVVPTVTLPSAG